MDGYVAPQKSMAPHRCLALVPAALAATTVQWGAEPMRMSHTGPASTLPSFFFMAGDEEGGALFSSFGFEGGRGTPQPWKATTTCPDDVFEQASPDLRAREPERTSKDPFEAARAVSSRERGDPQQATTPQKVIQ